jgi:endoglucanase
MCTSLRRFAVLLGLPLIGAGALLGCQGAPADPDSDLSALLDDGDASTMAPLAAAPPAAAAPPRTCPGGDCTRLPLAYWKFDDCNTRSTELADSAASAGIAHRAFRAVSVACVAGKEGQAVRLAGSDDVVYAPDQPDFVFDRGLTVAAWIKPDRLVGTQNIVRKRQDQSSSFVLALDGKRLVLALRLTNGRVLGASAPIQAGRFSHVAATYDGRQVVLFINGAAVATARGTGTIAPGVGPIFAGNDANGRRFQGIVDSVWLNTLGAPAAAVAGLLCVAPVASLSPAMSAPAPSGSAVSFDLAVTNPNDATCPDRTFDFALVAPSLPPGWTAAPAAGSLMVAPGATAHAAISVTSLPDGPPGAFPFRYTVTDHANAALTATAQAVYVVAPPMRTGCATATPPPSAPGGYFVNGNTICTGDGRPHLFHGVDRPSLEFLSGGQNLSLQDSRLMASWNANVVRIALNQDFWLAASPIANPDYPSIVDAAIRWAEMAGMDVILDLHWSDRGVLGSCDPSGGCQQVMPDANSITFWSEVAARYKNDGRVLFELYNEPHDVSWSVWKSGGSTGPGGFMAVGMQQLYDTVRATGAENLVVIGGLDFAYDLSGVPANRIAGHNIVYATHPYRFPGALQREPASWGASFGFLTQTDPVMVTEFGDLSGSCSTDYQSQLLDYADGHAMGWTAWAWYPGGCVAFPSLIADWAGTTTALGALVKSKLLGYVDPPALPPRAGPGTNINYTFDGGTEGWRFNTFNGGLTNLAVVTPPGATPPTISFAPGDGEPSSGPGALKVTVGFSAVDQYVDPNVEYAPPGLAATGSKIHMRVRRVSGSFAGFLLHAGSGSSFVFTSTFVNGDQFPLGAWVPVTIDLGAGASPGFDPSQVVQIGFQLFSGFSGGAPFVPTGDTVVEIDGVSDDPPAPPPPPSLAFTFDGGTAGWIFNTFNGGLTNLAAVTPPGATPPVLAFEGGDGDPASGPGSLKVTVGFTAFDQYVDPTVDFPQPGLDLSSGSALHVNIKLVSGSFVGGGVQFHAGSGPSFAFAGAFMNWDQFPLGVWVPVTLSLNASGGFDPTQVVQLGVQFFSGFSGGGGVFTPSGDTVFEIDSVTN